MNLSAVLLTNFGTVGDLVTGATHLDTASWTHRHAVQNTNLATDVDTLHVFLDDRVGFVGC